MYVQLILLTCIIFIYLLKLSHMYFLLNITFKLNLNIFCKMDKKDYLWVKVDKRYTIGIYICIIKKKRTQTNSQDEVCLTFIFNFFAM